MEEKVINNIGFQQFKHLSITDIQTVQPSRHERLKNSNIQLLDGVQSNGLLIVAKDSGGFILLLGYSAIQFLQSDFSSKEEKSTFLSSSIIPYTLEYRLHYLSFVNNDSMIIGIPEQMDVLYFWKLENLLKKKDTSPWRRVLLKEKIIIVRPNKLGELTLLVSEKGNLYLVNSIESPDTHNFGNQIPDLIGSLTDIQWSSKKENGINSVLIGTDKGDIYLFNIEKGPRLVKKKKIKGPNENLSVNQIITFSHSPNLLMIVQSDLEISSTKAVKLYLLDQMDDASNHWTSINDPTHSIIPSESNSLPHFYTVEISSWGTVKHLIVIGSSFSSDIGLIGIDSKDEKYQLWTIELDECMAILPMSEDLEDTSGEFDTFPMGMFMDSVSNTHPFPHPSKDPNDPPFPPTPVLWMLNTKSQLIGYQLALFDCSSRYISPLLESSKAKESVKAMIEAWEKGEFYRLHLDSNTIKPSPSKTDKPVNELEKIEESPKSSTESPLKLTSDKEDKISPVLQKMPDPLPSQLKFSQKPIPSNASHPTLPSTLTPLDLQIASFEKELLGVRGITEDVAKRSKDLSLLVSSSFHSQRNISDQLNDLCAQRRSFLESQMDDVTDLVESCLSIVEMENDIKFKLDDKKRSKPNITKKEIMLDPVHSRSRRIFRAKLNKIQEGLNFIEARLSLLTLAFSQQDLGKNEKLDEDPALVRLVSTINKLNVHADEVYENVQKLTDAVGIHQSYKELIDDQRKQDARKIGAKSFSFGLCKEDCIINTSKKTNPPVSSEKNDDINMSYRQFRWNKLCTPPKSSAIASKEFTAPIPNQISLPSASQNTNMNQLISRNLSTSNQSKTPLTNGSATLGGSVNVDHIIQAGLTKDELNSKIVVTNNNEKKIEDVAFLKERTSSVDKMENSQISKISSNNDKLINKVFDQSDILKDFSISKPEKTEPTPSIPETLMVPSTGFSFPEKKDIPLSKEKAEASDIFSSPSKIAPNILSLSSPTKGSSSSSLTNGNALPASTPPPFPTPWNSNAISNPHVSTSFPLPPSTASPFSFFESPTAQSTSQTQPGFVSSFNKALGDSSYITVPPPMPSDSTTFSTPNSSSLFGRPQLGTNAKSFSSPSTAFGQASFGSVTPFGQAGSGSFNPTSQLSSSGLPSGSPFSFSSVTLPSNLASSPFSAFASTPSASFAQVAETSSPNGMHTGGAAENQKSTVLKSQSFTQFRG